MIEMAQPSLVLHSHDVPGYKYKMWATWDVPKTLPTASIVDWIASAVDQSSEMALKNVILNSHGLPGEIYMGNGGKPIDEKAISADTAFKKLRSKSIGTIWIVACLVGSKPFRDSEPPCRMYPNDGPSFCSKLATIVGCDVIASDASQTVSPGFEFYARLPFTGTGMIDDYEGNVTRYGPDGSRKRIGQSGQGRFG